MQCLETLLGPEAYFAILALAVGVICNGVKRIKFVPSDAIPVIAFVLGWALDTAAGRGCGLGFVEAALTGLGGGLAGLAAAGGHEALARTARRLGLEGLASKLLGKAKLEKAKRAGAASLLVILLALSGCAGVLPALAKAAQGAQWIGTVVDVAKAGADTYFARHPNFEASSRVDELVRSVRLKLERLDRAIALGQNIVEAKDDVLQEYGELRAELADLGITSAAPPDGGAETDAPAPEPFDLPTVEELRASL